MLTSGFTDWLDEACAVLEELILLLTLEPADHQRSAL
jgi:hypothetical protein